MSYMVFLLQALHSVLNSNPQKKSALIRGKNLDLRQSIDLRKVCDIGTSISLTLWYTPTWSSVDIIFNTLTSNFFD